MMRKGKHSSRPEYGDKSFKLKSRLSPGKGRQEFWCRSVVEVLWQDTGAVRGGPWAADWGKRSSLNLWADSGVLVVSGHCLADEICAQALGVLCYKTSTRRAQAENPQTGGTTAPGGCGGRGSHGLEAGQRGQPDLVVGPRPLLDEKHSKT